VVKDISLDSNLNGFSDDFNKQPWRIWCYIWRLNTRYFQFGLKIVIKGLKDPTVCFSGICPQNPPAKQRMHSLQKADFSTKIRRYYERT